MPVSILPLIILLFLTGAQPVISQDAAKPEGDDPTASITKLMAAWLIARLADDDPQVLSERVTFSKRAEETIGSSAELRAGEAIEASTRRGSNGP